MWLRSWRRGAAASPFPFAAVRGCPERLRRSEGRWRGRAEPGRADSQYMTSSTRWHSHPGALPGLRLHQRPSPLGARPVSQPVQRVPAAPSTGCSRGSGSARLGPVPLGCSCQGAASTNLNVLLTWGKEIGIFSKLLEILFYQALTLICLLGNEASLKVFFSLLEFMPVYNPSLNEALYI